MAIALLLVFALILLLVVCIRLCEMSETIFEQVWICQDLERACSSNPSVFSRYFIFLNRGDADLSTLCWEKLGTSLDAGLKDKVPLHLRWSWSCQTKTSGCLGDRRKHRDWSSSGHGSRQKWSQSGNHCKVSRPIWISDFKKKYFRRCELLDKVKDQCIAKGGSASQVE